MLSRLYPVIAVAWMVWMVLGDFLHPVSSGQGILSAPGIDTLPVAVSSAALDALSRNEPAQTFPVACGTPVRIVRRHFTSDEIELPDRRRGWVFSGWVFPK